jgi:two-component sensor histidine kinase
MQHNDDVVVMHRSRAALEARLRRAVAMHAERYALPPARVVDAVERFLDAPPGGEKRLAEMRHRVQNEMQLLASAMRRRRAASSGSDTAPCDACIGQVTALAQLNAEMDKEMSSQPEADTDLGQQALRFASAMRSAFGLDTGANRLEIRTEQLFVLRKVARNVLLVLNEAVTNAVKHGIGADGGADGGAIRVDLSSIAVDMAELTVENESTGARADRDGSSGRSLIDALAAGIGGHVVRQATGDAFCLTFRFPLPRARAAAP